MLATRFIMIPHFGSQTGSQRPDKRPRHRLGRSALVSLDDMAVDVLGDRDAEGCEGAGQMMLPLLDLALVLMCAIAMAGLGDRFFRARCSQD